MMYIHIYIYIYIPKCISRSVYNPALLGAPTGEELVARHEHSPPDPMIYTYI